LSAAFPRASAEAVLPMTAMVPDAAPAPRRSRFDGLKLSASAERTPAGSGRGLGVANQRYARAVQDIGRMIEQGLPALEYQKIAEVQAARALDAMRQNGASDLDAVFAREPGLVSEAAKGRTANCAPIPNCALRSAAAATSCLDANGRRNGPPEAAAAASAPRSAIRRAHDRSSSN
jgi:hypothetical protein